MIKKNEKGITIIVLLIIIIIMLILAAVTVTMAIDSGLFNITKSVAHETTLEGVKENRLSEARINVTGYDEDITFENFVKEPTP